MDLVLAGLLLAVVAVALLMRRSVFGGTNLAGAMGTLVVGPRPDGWPVGVQEEDRDRPWGTPARPPAPVTPETAPPLMRLRPVVRAR